MAKDQDLGGKLIARIEPRDGGTSVVLSGGITELAKFKPLMSQPGPLRIDLAGIERINSLGVRGWVDFVYKCETAGVELTFERCAPVLVQQASMISTFFGTRSRVQSLFVPYLCPKCNAEDLKLIDVPRGAPLAVETSVPCPKCGSPMQLDELEEMYGALFGNG